MKFLIAGSLLLISLFVPFLQTPAHALTFSNAVPFLSGSDPFVNVSYTTSQSGGFTWTHDLASLLSGGILSAAQLAVTYSRTNLDELWQVEGLGNFTSSFNEATVIFPLTASAIQDLQADGILTLKLKELTSGADSFRLHQSILSGSYELPVPKAPAAAVPSVPEPAMLFYGLGMLGALGFNRRRKFRKEFPPEIE